MRDTKQLIHKHAGQLVILVVLTALTGARLTAAEKNEFSSHDNADTTESLEQTEIFDEDIQDIDLLQMEIPVVVTAGRREQQITTVPYAVSVITKEDIRLAGARTIPDALRLAPGVDVSEIAYGNATVGLRGLHAYVSREVLVLVDGRQVFDSLFGGTLWTSWPFQIEDIERIEVIRGPGGVTWGANAVNGVINIITKDPADQLGLTVTAGGGSRGIHKEHLGYAFQEDKLRMRVSGEYEASDGFRKGGSFLRKLDDDHKIGRMNVHAIYDAGPNDKLTISGGSALLDGGYPAPPSTGFGLSRNSGSQASFLLGKWDHKFASDNLLTATGYVNDFHISPGVPAIEYRYQQLAFQVSHSFKPVDTHTLTWGIDSRVDLVDASNADPFLLTKDFVSTAIIGIYAQDEWRFAPKWTLNLGGRIDYEFYGGFQPSARAALSYELTDTSMVYGAVSRAFQMTPAASRFLNLPTLNGLAWVTANRNLDAQPLLAYELGYRGKFLERLDTNLNLFLHHHDDFVAFPPELGPPGLIVKDLDNRGSANFYGLELDAKYAATEKLTLLGNYTFQLLDLRGVPRGLTELIGPPKHKFMLGARYALTDDIRLSSHLYYVDAVEAPNPANPFIHRRIDPYFRLDLRAEYEFWNDRASVAVGASNLLDSDHYEGGTAFLNDAEVPRVVYVEFRMTLN